MRKILHICHVASWWYIAPKLPGRALPACIESSNDIGIKMHILLRGSDMAPGTTWLACHPEEKGVRWGPALAAHRGGIRNRFERLEMTQDNRWDKGQVTAIIADLKDQPGALLPVLHGIQDALGYIPEDVVPLIAKEMNMTRADVHGVITFYHHFRQTPPGQHTIHICRAFPKALAALSIRSIRGDMVGSVAGARR